MPVTPPVRKRSTEKVVLTVFVAVFVAVGAGTIVAAVLAGQGSSTGSLGTPTTAATAASTPTRGTPTVSPSAVPTTAAASPAFKTVPAWYAGGGQTLINAISTDFAAIRAASGNHDATAANEACIKLETDVAAAQRLGPIPDDQAQQYWAKALSDIGQGATDCENATYQQDGSLLAKGASEMNYGSAQLDLLFARVRALTA